MRDFDAAATGRHRRGFAAVDPQEVKTDSGTDDVGDRIDRADLVEVHLLQGGVVHLGFGLPDEQKDALGKLTGSRRQFAAGVDHRFDVVQVAVSVFGRVLDIDFDRTEARFFDDFRADLHLLEAHRGDAGLNSLQRHPQVQQRAEDHIATDAAETVKVCNSQSRSPQEIWSPDGGVTKDSRSGNKRRGKVR